MTRSMFLLCAAAGLLPAVLVAQDTTEAVDSLAPPPAADSVLRFTTVTAGGAHSCGLTAEGAAYCWGDNQYGQLGDSTTTDRASPVLVKGEIPFAVISAGERHTCGIDTDGIAYCWGDNEHGQSGNGAERGRSYPLRVQGRNRMKLMVAGSQHTCSTVQHWEQDDRVFCWGRNSDGQLGNREVRNAAAPAPAFGTIRYTHLASGTKHTCGVTVAGTVMCWGDNSRGQLGNGSITGSPVPFPIRISPKTKLSVVAAGAAHTCAATKAAEVWCWGDNSAGQLGNGKKGREMVPDRVDRAVRLVSLSAGGNTTCGLRADGLVYCWGSNAAGQFGEANPPDSPNPIAVLRGYAFTAMALGMRHGCGVQEDGSAFCWGAGMNGGPVSETSGPGPVRITGTTQPREATSPE